jgi:hypothetical protein
MALKSDRYELQTDISFFYNEGTATRGGVVVHDTAGSGAAMDQGVNLVKYAAVTSASRPVGILLNDVVNKDLTRTHLNQHKDEVQQGGKVTVLRKGYVVTSNVTGTPSAGADAYRCTVTAGNLSTVASGVKVGAFLTSKDDDGYAKVEVNLP